MTDDNYYYRKHPRITFESALLLAIFVGAALFMAALAYTIAPWESDGSPTTDATVAGSTDTGDVDADSGDEIVDETNDVAP